MDKPINKISVDDLYDLIKNHKCTQEEIDAYKARRRMTIEQFIASGNRAATQEEVAEFEKRCEAREKEFKNSPGAHHRFNYNFKYGPCD